MALSFMKKQASGVAPGAGASPTVGHQAKKTSGLKFLKVGSDAKSAIQAEEARAELAKQEAGRLWRFRMQEGADRQITFLDGDLNDDGLLDVPMFHEHTVRVNGSWENFVCTADVDESQPCPLCEAGDRASLVGVMTVIDHSKHIVQKGQNAGKVIQNTRRLFVAKMNTLKLLTKIAAKRGGLAGCTFDVSRTGDKSPAVGDQFDFVHKFETFNEIAEKWGLKIEDAQPANYEEEIRFRSPDELIALGIGKAVGASKTFSKPAAGNLSDEL